MKATSKPRRSGLSLMELLVVVSLLGIFSTTAMMRFGRDIFGDAGARSAARVIGLGLLQAQRAAIRTGDSHGIRFHGSVSDASSWSMSQKLSDGSEIIVDGPHAISDDVTIAASHVNMWFNFEGDGASLYTVDLTGPNRSYRITVEPLTRMIRTVETTP